MSNRPQVLDRPLTGAERTRRYRARHPDRIRLDRRRGHLRRTYSISIEDYSVLLEEQGGVCAVCGETNPSGRRLAVDHDHTTGQVRGLLCFNCNRAAGSLKDDPSRAIQLAEYLGVEVT